MPVVNRCLAAVAMVMAVSSQAQVAPARRDQILHMLKQDCGSCHGMTLKGGLGPALTPGALEKKPNAYLEAVILQGRPGTPMPPWRPFLNETEVRWLVGVLKSGNFEHED